ncbi:unnamed protein product [Cylicocyclus nassatus]|uniref:Uncharacterized protein n=1 Tax=Cylicocyclus nassatus TaxID=53992 RepID=A0AA36H7V6_CYLNA|nr:unnamed protein product [Cylicocyclus nassatus]
MTTQVLLQNTALRDFAPGNFQCDRLKTDCLTRPNSNGYCYIYRQKCNKDEDVEARLESSLYGDLSKNCPRWKRKCSERGPADTSCIRFSEKCAWLNMTTESDYKYDGSSSSEEKRYDLREKQKMEKMCSKWERKCIEKWPNLDHYSCRMLNKKCRTHNPIIQPITGLKPDYASEVTESVAVQDREKLMGQCQRWKKTCARKYPRHSSCRHRRFSAFRAGTSSALRAGAPTPT